MTGQFWGRLTVIGYAHTKKKRAFWDCLCECGNKCIVSGKQLRSGKTRSCGCYMRDRAKQANTTHGETGTRLNRIWRSMKTRVGNKKDRHWKWYGSKGIKICKEWLIFVEFKRWALQNGYSKDLTIERIDYSKDYEPDNCCWITMAAQQRNKSNNIKYKGETAAEASRRLGGNRALVRMRIGEYGWDIKKAFNTPK